MVDSTTMGRVKTPASTANPTLAARELVWNVMTKAMFASARSKSFRNEGWMSSGSVINPSGSGRESQPSRKSDRLSWDLTSGLVLHHGAGERDGRAHSAELLPAML